MLQQMVTPAELIKTFECKICGRTATLSNYRVGLVNTWNGGICPQCQSVLDWVERRGGRLPAVIGIEDSNPYTGAWEQPPNF